MSLRKNRFPYDAEIFPEIPKKTQQNTPTTKKKPEREKHELCSICCESSEKTMYINCKKGGVQKNNFGRGSSSCKDKPICVECRQKCIKSCPFCRNHKLHIIETARYPKKKKAWAVRKVKIMEKQKLRKKKNTNITVIQFRLEGEEMNIFGDFYCNFDYRVIM